MKGFDFMNYQDYLNAQEEMEKCCKEITVDMLLGKTPRPAELEARTDELEKIIWKYEHDFPYAVRVDGAGRYKMVGRYATAEEAIDNCPEYDAHVINTITHETVYYTEKHPDTHTW